MPSDRERVDADPELLAAVRARYEGEADVLDVLWWLEHPGEPTPAGREDPAVVVERERRALYRPGAPADGAERVAAAERAAQRDAESARRAVADALAEHRPAGRARAAVRSHPGRLLAAVGVAGLLVGAAVGALLARPPERPAALAVFDRTQRADDRPPTSAPLPDAIEPSTLRLLGSSSASGTEVFAARARDGRVCLVAVVLALEFHSTCTAESAFALDGLRLAYDARVDPADLSGAVRIQEIAATWSPTGALRF